MSDTTTPFGGTEHLEVRLKKLADDKSQLELIIQLMNRMSSVPGLENTVTNMLYAVGDVIGGVNIILYYRIDESLYYADIFGLRKQVVDLDDEIAQRAFQSREAVEVMHDFSDTRMLTTEFSKAYTWAIPLLVGKEVIGVLKMESLHLAMRDLSHKLPTFFNYAGLVLKNEILGHTRLRRICSELEQEVAERKRMEEALRLTNEVLEEKVGDRTADLEQMNEELLERELRIRTLLERSESQGRALLSILEDQKHAEEEERRLNRELRAISTCNQALLHAVDEQALLEEICRIICEEAGYSLAWVGYPEHDAGKTIRPVASAGAASQYLASTRLSWAEDDRHGQGPSGMALRGGETVYIQDIAADPRMAAWHDLTREHGYRSSIALALKDSAGAVFGVLQIYSSVVDAFTASEIQLLEELAGDLAYGIMALRTRAERDRAECDRQSSLKFFESMDLINRAIQRTEDREGLMREVLGTVLAVLDCDRAWLAYPCNPDAVSWHVPMECTKPAFPGALEAGVEVSMRPDAAGHFRTVLAADGPVCFGPETSRPVGEQTALRYSVQSQIAMAIYPKSGEPYMFGLHQCTHPRVWTGPEQRLFQEIGRRIEDGLTSILAIETLRESEGRLEEAQHIARLGHWECDLISGRTSLSDEARRIFGLPADECIDHLTQWQERWMGLIHAADRETTAQAAATALGEGRPGDVEYRVIQPGGSVRIVQGHTEVTRDESGRPRRMFGTIQDITERRMIEKALEESESRLRQSQKMEAIGQLAGGVAHDFNNMLSVILGHADLALLKTEPSDPRHTDLQSICEAANRSADLTRQLLGFARKQTVIPQVLDLNETVESMLKMMRRLIGEDIELNWLPGSILWPVKMDPSQIDQILANLCVNARDAISGVGRVCIETDTASVDLEFCTGHPEASPGDYVRLSINDNGCGMDAETLSRVFEPFFTTKALGKGTGLGLATVYGIVKQNSGFIHIETEPGHGTTFHVYLPRHETPETDAAPENIETPAARGHETILLVEDEPAILNVATLMLQRQGYRVLGAPSPGDALEIARAFEGPIHLVLTDVVMPDMNGWRLAQELTALHPGLTCLFMSGYTGNIVAEKGLLDMDISFIQKPFSMRNLTCKVRAVLDGKRD